MNDIKCALIIDPSLPAGILANTAAVLALSLGRARPGLIGAELHNQAGERHQGITTHAMPVLQASPERLWALREAARPHESQLTVIDLIDATRRTRSYEEYAAELASTPVDRLRYQGLALMGPKKLVNTLTGSLGLLR